jgi:precorrin-6A/cobalt-precorrin-6A reductase
VRVLLLGGTSDATALAHRFAADDRFAATLSLAGRTANPAPSPIAVRVGGFGGPEGMARHIEADGIDIVVDATHPFAAQISANAVAACALARRPLIALERPAWRAQSGDRWRTFASVADAVAALPEQPARVFSGLGRLSLAELEAAPQHRYVIRLIDPPLATLALPHATLVMGRGPFKTEDDIALFTAHGIEFVLAKNAGGMAAVSKIEAARALGLTVMMIDRPIIAGRTSCDSVEAVWVQLKTFR